MDNAIQWWMGAIYHRFPIVSPRTEHIGYGPYYKSGRGVSVLDFGNDYALTGAMTRYPVVNQTGVGVKLDGEFPNPVAQFGGSFPTGYPVSITWYRGAVKYTSMKMVRKDGLDVPGYKLSPENDEPEPGLTFHKWSTSLSFIPKAPLALGTRYTVTIAGVYAANGNLATGSAFTYTWSFTTMPGPPAAPTTTPAANAVAVSRTANLVLQYNQPLRAYTMVPTTTASGINVGGVGASLRNEATGQEAAISIVPPTTETSRFVTITPGAPLAPNTTYRLSYRFADAWGRLTSGSVRFTTAKT
ncbi:MAG: Ig-like domain-containing protein [Chloroflexia bacterium]